MPAAISVNLRAFKEQLAATTAQLQNATRPAAQAGAEVMYQRAKQHATELKSDREHYFYGTASKNAPKGSKKNFRYGPFQPGNLSRAIYQVFSQSRSFKDVSTYEISWNKDKAPYGYMVELGTSTAAAHSFIGRAVIETRAEVREAMKARYIEEVKK